MDEYSLPCSCGAELQVHPGQCGLSLSCPQCGRPVQVPNLKELRSLAGDRYPTLSDAESLALTLYRREAPFDGHCHRCGGAAEYAATTVFHCLKERVIIGNEGIRLLPLFSEVSIGAAEEDWRTLNVPVALCRECFSKFDHDRRSARRQRLIRGTIALLLAAPLVLLVTITLMAILPLAAFVLIALGLTARSRSKSQAPEWLKPYLARLPAYRRLLENEHEYRLTVRTPELYAALMEQIPAIPNGS